MYNDQNDNQYYDRDLECQDCHQPFVFTAGEQSFFASKQLNDDPKRCKPCRDIRKANKNLGGQGGGQQYHQNNGNSYGNGNTRPSNGGGQQYQNRNGGGGNRRNSNENAQRYDVTCADCGVETTVPFVPAANRPVFCRDCYKNQPR